MLSSYIVDFLLICIITLCYLTLYADPQLKIAIFWSCKTIVLCRALKVKEEHRFTQEFWKYKNYRVGLHIWTKGDRTH